MLFITPPCAHQKLYFSASCRDRMALALVTMPNVLGDRGSLGGVFQLGWLSALKASNRKFTVWLSLIRISLASDALKVWIPGLLSTSRPSLPIWDDRFGFVKSKAAAFQKGLALRFPGIGLNPASSGKFAKLPTQV